MFSTSIDTLFRRSERLLKLIEFLFINREMSFFVRVDDVFRSKVHFLTDIRLLVAFLLFFQLTIVWLNL